MCNKRRQHIKMTMQHFKSLTQVNNKLKSVIVQTVLEPDHNYACIAHSDEDMQTELDVRTVLESDHNYAQIAHSDEDMQKELGTTVAALAVKEEKCKRLESADEDHSSHYMSVMNETDFNANKTKEENFSDQSIMFKAQLIDDAVYKAFKKDFNAKIKEENSDESIMLETQLIDYALNKALKKMNPAVAKETQDPIKFESITYECTLCSEEFVNEQEYQVHMGAHLQLQLRSHPKAQYAQYYSPLANKVVDMAPNLKTYSDRKVHSNAEIDAVVLVTKSPFPMELVKNEASDTIDEIDILAIEDKTIVEDLRKSQFTLLEPNESLAKIRNNINGFQKSQNEFQNYTFEISFTCEICNFKCKTNGRLLNHMRTHSGEETFTCEICNYKCKTKRKLVSHMRSHTSENFFACELCTFKCKRNCILVNHNKKVHTGKKPFACELCNYKCKTSFCFVNHMRTHSGEKPFACELCNFRSTEKSNLVRHMRTHTGVKPFVCDICNHKFSVKCNLLNHMRTHTGDKPFACELCKFKCKEKSGLIRHMKTHTNVKPFSCKVCNYKCIRESRLVAHMRIHTGEKPFACKLCPYKFVENCDLVKHIRTRHNGVKNSA